VHSYLFGFDYSATIPAKLCGVPLIISSRRELAKWKKIHHRILGKLEFLTTDRIVSCSEAAKCFAAEDEGVYIEKIKTIYNGVNLKLFYPRPKDKKILEEFKLNEGGPVIGTVTKFVKVKDVETTLKAVVEICRAFCETKVLVIGGGEIEGNLKRKVLDLGLERNIIFTGFREDIPSLLSVMDVFMLSSLSEGLPNVILEAMASGLPVVATKVGGIPEVVVEGESGFLVQPRDFRNLAAAVIRFLENKELRFRMGSRGRMIAEERFALGKMVSDYETLYSVRKPKCPVCFYYKCAHMFQKQRNNFFRCNHCGLIFIWPQPDLGTINRMYEDWGKEYYLSLEKLDLAFNASFQERLDKIEPFRKNNRLLDIGCSTGAFLSAAQKRNWQAYGVEISLPSVEYARKNKKLDVFLGTLEEARYEDEYFDVIIAWAVLEHVPDPLRILKESQRILRKGGLLFFCVPNFNSLPIKLIGKKYRYIQEGHLFYFTKRSVSIMLEKSGFKLCRMTSEYFSPLSFIEDLRGIVPNTRETETRERNIVNKARNTKLHYLVVRPLWRTFMFIVRRMELGDELSVIALK
jgi:2-polyprenyl-3-methyl-5-hydroxy-6-metoxy-1,4-benzoquinol methylase